MNLTNYQQTPIHQVFEAVLREAGRHGVPVLESEIIGLVPEQALIETAKSSLRLKTFADGQILERKLRG
jgi:glutamate formiminotransferase